MKFKILLFLLLISFALSAQNSLLENATKLPYSSGKQAEYSSNKKVGYLTTIQGDTIKFYPTAGVTREKKYSQIISGYVALTNEFVFYYNEKGERIKFHQKKIRRLEYFDQSYINLPVGSIWGLKRLHEVVAENNKYILTNYYSSAYYLYVYNKETSKFQVSKEWNSFKRKKDLKLIEKKIIPYFKDCKDLIEQLKANVEIGDYDTQKKEFRSKWGTVKVRRLLFGSIYNFQCD